MGDHLGGNQVFQAGDEDRQGGNAILVQARYQRIDGFQIPRLYKCAVEDDCRLWRILLPMRLNLIDPRVWHAGPIEPAADQRGRFQPLGLIPNKPGGEAQELLAVIHPALHQILPEPVAVLGRYRRAVGQFHIRLIVAGQKRDREVGIAGQFGDLVEPVRPIADAPQQPHDDQLGVGEGGVQIGIDREVVAKLQQVGEPQRRLFIQPSVRLRQHRKIAGRRREHDDLARRLAEIDGFGTVDNLTGLGG